MQIRPWVDQVATHIYDPVARLRFLKAVAPPIPYALPRTRRRWLHWLAIAVVAMAAVCGLAVLPPRGSARPSTLPAAPRATISPVVAARARADVWLVERTGNTDSYSNGLRVDSGFLTDTHPRAYLAFPLARPGPAEQRTRPAGLVFHTTESAQAPFEARHNGTLKRIGESLLEYVRRRQSYNFVIDRFGRVYRVVPEDQAANHAGHSLWTDAEWAYLNLNDSFVGVSFEAETRNPELAAGQVRSGTMLVEMLRSRFGIPAGNCVTHAQVSVNPSNMRVGYHADWAAGFPFAAFGLPDNYAAPLASLGRYGFEADEGFRAGADAVLRQGIAAGEAAFAANARASGLQPAAYRALQRKNYRELMEEVNSSRR